MAVNKPVRVMMCPQWLNVTICPTLDKLLAAAGLERCEKCVGTGRRYVQDWDTLGYKEMTCRKCKGKAYYEVP